MQPKNNVGRPLAFKSKEELEAAIEEYFDYCDNRIQHIFSPKLEQVIEVIDPAPYTMSGLARALGIDRRTLVDYAHRDEYLPTIKAARERVHEDVERRLMEKNATGAIFNLKNNFGWKDKSEIDNTHRFPTPILGGTSKDVPVNDSDEEVAETQETD